MSQLFNENLYKIFYNSKNILKKTLNANINVFNNVYFVFIFWVILHYISSHMYIYYCTPKSVYGFSMSPFIIAAPHCQALSWVVYNGGNTIISMWITFGFWLLNFINPMINKNVSVKNEICDWNDDNKFRNNNNFNEVIDLTLSDDDDDDNDDDNDADDDNNDHDIMSPPPPLTSLHSDDDDSVPPLINVCSDDDDDDDDDDDEYTE